MRNSLRLAAMPTQRGDLIPLGQEKLWNGDGANVGAFDFWPIAGQSNNLTGRFAIPAIDRVPNPRIAKINNTNGSTGYSGPYIDKLLYCVEPFEGFQATLAPQPGWTIGYARSFAENLLVQGPSEVTGRNLLFKRYAVGGTGFFNTGQSNWAPGSGSLYDKMIPDILAILNANPQIQLRGFLWHQGEEDQGDYSDADWLTLMTNFIALVRSDLKTPDLPFIVGGYSPDTVAYNGMTARCVALPSTISWMGAMDPRVNGQSGYPGDTSTAVIGVGDEPVDGIQNDTVHFAATTQRDHIGPRYTKAWLSSLTHNNPGGADNAYTVPDAIADLAAVPGDVSATLNFTIPSNGGAVVAGYDCQISPTGAGTWSDAPTRFCGPGRKLTGLTNAVAIDVRVRSRNKAGNSNWSNTATVTPGLVYESETTSLLALMSTQPNTALAVAINSFIRDMKAATVSGQPTAINLWAKLDMFQYYALHDEQAALLDWKQQDRVLAKTGSPTWAAKHGYTPAVNTNRIQTGYNPGDGGTYNLLQTSVMIAVGVATDSAVDNPDMGAASGLSLRIWARAANDTMILGVNDANSTGREPSSTSIGRFYGGRLSTSTSTKRFYRNGVSLGTQSQAAAAVVNGQILALGAAGSTASSLRQIYFVAAGGGFSDQEIAAFDGYLSALNSGVAAS